MNQDMIIYRCMLKYDSELNGKNAVFHDELAEIWAVNRACAVWELNKHGIKVLQFLHDSNSGMCGEWVLIERANV